MRLTHVLLLRALGIQLAIAMLAGASATAQEQPSGTAPVLFAAASQPPLAVELRPIDRDASRQRPGALMPMYGSLIALQALDIHSTRRGMSSGRTRESNPLMGAVVENGAAFLAVKAAATTGAIWATEKMWKKHPKRAIIFAALINATMAAVVTHNYRAANQK